MRRQQLPYNHTLPFYNKKLNYQVFGQGEPLIFLHGGVTNSSSYTEFLQKLGKFYKVYALDFPGYGGSDSIPNKKHDTDFFAEAVCTFTKELKIRNAIVIAFSTGTVAAAKAITLGCLTGKVIFVGVPGKLTGWQMKFFNSIPLSIKRALFSTHFGKTTFLLPILKENTGTGNSIETDEMLMKHISYTDVKGIVDMDVQKEFEQEMPNLLEKIKVPILFVYGEHDKNQETTKDMIKKVTIIPHTDHNIFALDPDTTLKVLLRLLQLK